MAEDWTVAGLAPEAGMSQSSFADSFRKRTGLTPMQYVAQWRLFGIRRALLESDQSFSIIAENHGWKSRTSCSRAFQKLLAISPQSLRSPR
ncbi:helix-turn-helix transcriptional regulator [Pelobacter seleniigenes]|uniref:helix-turn-helix transcriptional regulator n=1 Tax=Pelobacter seleniigenes TaxID=407188 RepID=UPI003CCBF32F